MSTGRNLHVATGAVLENLRSYSDSLQEEIESLSALIVDHTAAIDYLGEASSFPQVISNFRESVNKNTKEFGKCSELMSAVNAILNQEEITEVQQKSLIEDAKEKIADADTQQFIASYLQNYTEAKDVEIEIYRKANAFFATAPEGKVSLSQKQKEAMAKEEIEAKAKAFFASAPEGKVSYISKPTPSTTKPGLLHKIFGKRTNEGPALKVNGDDKGSVNTKTV